jgi:hypothetical protein
VEKEGTMILNPPSCKLLRAKSLVMLVGVLLISFALSLATPSRVWADGGGFPTLTPTVTTQVSVQESNTGAASPKPTSNPTTQGSKSVTIPVTNQPQTDDQPPPPPTPTPTPTEKGGGILTNVYCMVISIVVLAAAVFIYLFFKRSKKKTQ